MKSHCNISPPIYQQKFSGETFSINVVLVGQFNGTVRGIVQASLKSTHSNLKQEEYVQNISSIDCNQLNYTIYTGHDREGLHLKVQRFGDISEFKESQKIKIKNLPSK